jgi:hypothetical protein
MPSWFLLIESGQRNFESTPQFVETQGLGQSLELEAAKGAAESARPFERALDPGGLELLSKGGVE